MRHDRSAADRSPPRDGALHAPRRRRRRCARDPVPAGWTRAPLSWILLLLSLLVAAVTLVLALAAPPSEPVLIATRRIAIVRRGSRQEVVGGVSPVLRPRRLIAMMRLDLTEMTEQRFLAEWGDHSRWKQRFAEREAQARRAR